MKFGKQLISLSCWEVGTHNFSTRFHEVETYPCSIPSSDTPTQTISPTERLPSKHIKGSSSAFHQSFSERPSVYQVSIPIQKILWVDIWLQNSYFGVKLYNSSSLNTILLQFVCIWCHNDVMFNSRPEPDFINLQSSQSTVNSISISRHLWISCNYVTNICRGSFFLITM